MILRRSAPAASIPVTHLPVAEPHTHAGPQERIAGDCKTFGSVSHSVVTQSGVRR
jgi:hypothetical protein